MILITYVCQRLGQRANSKITHAIADPEDQLVIASLLIPLPPLAEQHRIVAKVDELMALCDQLDVERKSENDTRTGWQ